MPLCLRVEGLATRRGEDLIFRDLTFTLSSGDALLVTGRNGAGKSTLLRTLAGLIRAETGRMVLEGAPDQSAPPAECCHYLGHRNAMKRDLTVAENLAFWAAFTGSAARDDAVESALDAVGLAGLAHLPFAYLSAGQQRRIAIARLLVVSRSVWLMDEPTAALDAASERMVEGLIAGHRASGGIVIAATHQALDVSDAQTLVMAGFETAESVA